MIDVTFTINSIDFSDRLSTYRVEYEREVTHAVVTLNGTEHYAERLRPTIHFSLRPLSDAENNALYNAGSSQNTVVYSDPYRNTTVTATMRFTSNFSAQFGLKSIDGNRYYKGGELVLRQITVI